MILGRFQASSLVTSKSWRGQGAQKIADVAHESAADLRKILRLTLLKCPFHEEYELN